ncbi:MAG: TRAP transporter large permease [Peptoniphilus sp.]|uniref:TRAP-T family tripartite ATP-independent periplasmic transporter, membrane protein n=2 Tax=Peptoniphilus indolicus TaxID=33030 RepID=G4D2Z9_9FIRM|nr:MULTISPECIES: TRAP transporter large permease [Peptoniphilus]EGY80101.1 TRAP-T family tripartite ATP-independent periplasmic transporter, membrane protein [Peptoniphilus indolicus ATCC 29427]MDY2987516.1 TRAP transporter large permease [Peptoniphilus sp.]SUB75136.1 Neu5Ac permease [Peptoniphilus indolicus]
MIIVILFLSFLIGIPISFALGIVSLGQIISDGYPLVVVVQRMFTGMDSIALTAIPLFILSGGLMFKGGMSNRLVNFADLLLGHHPSGLAMVSILACMFFAAITGSAIAATAAIGGIMTPIMVEKGYDREFCAPLLATGGSIGPIIPPSIPLLIYGVMANVSVAKLFIGGFIPGIIMGVALIAYSYYIGKKRNYIGRDKKASFSEIIGAGKDAILALMMPIIIIGGIMSGVFSPTESATVATFYALITGMFVYKELKIKDLPQILLDAAKSTGQVLIVIAFASLFTWVITVNNIPQTVGAFLSANVSSKIVLLLIVNIILLIAGTFIDTTSAVVIFTPLFLPLAQMFGINLVHFGLIMAVNLTIGMCTPPLGVCLFVAGSIAKVSLKDQFKDLLPMLCVLLVVLLLITYIPDLVLILPNILVK